MSRLKVMVVDDSVVVRKVLTQIIAADPELEVVGTASNGRMALAKLPVLAPDVITLDVEMPEMNGLETLRALRIAAPGLPVIMISALTERGARTTLDALAAGARDYVAKPENYAGLSFATSHFRDELVPKLKALGRARRKTLRELPVIPPVVLPAPPPVPAPLRRRVQAPVEVVAVAASTGGPNALADFVACIPADFPVPVLVVQHMPPLFTRMLADRLSKRCRIDVREAAGGEVLSGGGIFIAPGNHHMVLERSGRDLHLRINQNPPENSCRPAADVLFRSVAAVSGPGVLAIVMTGMGQDGMRGCEGVRSAGGQVLAQDEASSVVWGMPGAVVGAGLADEILALDRLGPAMVRRVTSSRLVTYA